MRMSLDQERKPLTLPSPPLGERVKVRGCWGVLIFVFVSWMMGTLGLAADQADTARLPVNIEGSPAIGNPSAPVTIVEFTDFECPFCGRVQTAIKQIRERYPNEVRLVFKNFPLPFHPNARKAHLAALCAEEQGKFWDYRNLLFQDQKKLKRPDLVRYAQELGMDLESFEPCLDQAKYASKIEVDFNEAIDLGVQGTPAFLINRKALSGAQPFEAFERAIEEELRSSS